MKRTSLLTIVAMACVFVLITGFELVRADDPNDQSGTCYSSSGTIEESASCPAWFPALDRNSTDTQKTERIIVQFDACKISEPAYTVYTMKQNTPPGVLADLEPGDVFIEWDEDPGDGSSGSFTFSGEYEAIDDPCCDGFVCVSSAPEGDILNWSVFLVTESGTLTITDTTYNEHDAFHFHEMNLIKYDDVDDPECVSLDDEITYTICYLNVSDKTLYDVYIIDYLPDGVTYPEGFWRFDANMNSIPPDPNYDSETHTYTWQIGTVGPNDPNTCVELTVTVNDMSEPLGNLHNIAEIRDSNSLLGIATEDTEVCCYGGDIVYVDETASGSEAGTSWANAYTDLQDALARADNGCGNEIWVADAIYSPGNSTGTHLLFLTMWKFTAGSRAMRPAGTNATGKNTNPFYPAISMPPPETVRL